MEVGLDSYAAIHHIRDRGSYTINEHETRVRVDVLLLHLGERSLDDISASTTSS